MQHACIFTATSYIVSGVEISACNIMSAPQILENRAFLVLNFPISDLLTEIYDLILLSDCPL